MAATRRGRGGRREGAGRKPAFGEKRTRKVAVFITTDELKELQDYAAEIGASTVGHAVYQITRRFLKRRRE